MTVVSDKFQPVQDDIDVLVAAVDIDPPYVPGSQSAAVQDAVTALGTQNNRMHSVGGLIDRVDDLELTPPSDIVFFADFEAGGNVTKTGNDIFVDGAPAWKVIGPNNYGAGGSLTKIQSWNNPANLTLTSAGLVLHANMGSNTFSGITYPATACFAGTKDNIGSTAQKFPVPLWHEVTMEFTADGYVEDFDSVWLRHKDGSQHGEFDFFETLSAQQPLNGNKGLQYGVPNIGTALSSPWRARYNAAVGTRVTLVHRMEQISTNLARVTVTLNGLQPYQTVANNVNSSTIKVMDFDPTAIIGWTPDPNHAFDIALQKHEGYDYGANVLTTYSGTLRNGSTGNPRSSANNVHSWDENTPAQTSDLVIHSISVRSLVNPPPVPPDDCTSILHEPFNNFTTNSWTNVGGTVVTGRNGTAASITGSGGALGYAITTSKQSNYLTMGFAYRVSNVGASARSIFSLRDSANADFMTLRVNTDGSLSLIAGSAGTAYGTSAASLLATNTWAYLELKVFLDNTAGYYTVRVNGTSVLSATGVDTQSLATPASAIAILLLRTPGTVQNAQFDDLYISSGTSCTFQGDHVE